MRVYVVKQYRDDDGNPIEKELYRGTDYNRAEFIRNNNRDAFITVTHTNKK